MKSSLSLTVCGLALMSAWTLEGCKNGSVPDPGEEEGGSGAVEGGSDGGGTAGTGATGAAGGSATPGAYAGEGGANGSAGAPSDAGAPGAAGGENGGAPPVDTSTFRGNIRFGFSNTRADVFAQLDVEIWPLPTTTAQQMANAEYLEYLADYQMAAATDGECAAKPANFTNYAGMGDTIDVGPMFTASAGAMDLVTATPHATAGGSNPYTGGAQLGPIGLPGTVDILGPAAFGMQPNPVTVRAMDLGFEDTTIEWLSADEEFLLSLFFDGEWDEEDEGEAYFIVSIGDYQCKFYPPATLGSFSVSIPRDIVETLPQYFGGVSIRPVVFKTLPVSEGGFVRVETGVYLNTYASGTFN